MSRETSRPHYGLLDTVRGVCILSMVAYHGMYDLVDIFGLPSAWYVGLPGYVWQQSICWTFILLSGFCWPMGRRPLRRGLTVFACGWIITLVTVIFMPDEQIWFGVLTLIGACMLLLIPLERVLRHVPAGVGLAAAAALTVPAELYRNDLTAYLGFPGPGFFSTDYFSLLPWLFLFLAGYFLHRLCAPALERVDPDILRCRPLCALGRWSLPVYMIHQPVVYGVLTLFAALMR